MFETWKAGLGITPSQPQTSQNSGSFIEGFSNIFSGVVGAGEQLAGLANNWLEIQDKKDAQKQVIKEKEFEANLKQQEISLMAQNAQLKSQVLNIATLALVVGGGAFLIFKLVK